VHGPTCTFWANLTPFSLQGILSLKKIDEGGNVEFDEVPGFLRVMEEWKLGPGREEAWVGTLNQYFALHVQCELQFLKKEWGTGLRRPGGQGCFDPPEHILASFLPYDSIVEVRSHLPSSPSF
jgi:hypothetical protein